MTKESLERLIRELNAGGVRYLVVGGLAVIAHGYLRLTVDVDLIVQLLPENISTAMRILKGMGYTPKVPVAMEDFADPVKRASWINDKQMKVFGLRSDAHQQTDVDVFVNEPVNFDEAYGRSSEVQVTAGVQMRVCAYEDLIELKKQSNRTKDQLDLQQLRIARGEE